MQMRFALFWDITQLRVACRWDRYLPLKVGPTGFPETSVRNYHCTQRNIPEQRRSQNRKYEYMFSVLEAHLDLYCLVPSHMAAPFIPLLSQILFFTVVLMRILEAARSTAKVCGRSLAYDFGLKSRRGHGCVLRVMCVVRERSLWRTDPLPRSPTECVWVWHWVWSDATVTLQT